MAAKILFIGIDAADKDLILQWAREGFLPTFRSLQETGLWGATTNPEGLYVGAVWPSFLTGVCPAKHGRYCRARLKPGNKILALCDASYWYGKGQHQLRAVLSRQLYRHVLQENYLDSNRAGF